MKKLTKTPHDKSFRLSLSNIEVAKDFLATHLPKSIFKTIKLKTLTVCPTSFITPDLEESLSDILYNAKTTNNKDFYTYVVIEHQSTSNWDMPIRILKYQLAVIDSHLKQYPKQKQIPIVVPLLVYNGIKSPYPNKLNILDLFNDLELAKKTFAKPAHLIDLTQMSDEEIKQHNLISLLEFSQKHVRDRKFLKQATETLVFIINKLLKEVNKNKLIIKNDWFKNYLEGNLHYIYYFANIIDEQEFTKKLETVDFVKQENLMGALARKIEQQGIQKGIEKGIQQGIEKGIQQGIEKGIEKGMLEKARIIAVSMLNTGMDVELIAKFTGLSIDEINAISHKNDHHF